jgi:hypothetical protein
MGKVILLWGNLTSPQSPGLTQTLTLSQVRANPRLTAYSYDGFCSRICVARRMRFGDEMQCQVRPIIRSAAASFATP